MPSKSKNAVLVLSLLPSVALGANLGIIDGTVREYSGAPIAAAKVELLARGDRPVDEHATDADGHFAFEQVPFGRYRVVATAPDGRAESQEIRVSAGEVVRTEVFIPVALPELVVALPEPEAPEPSRSTSSTSALEREDIAELPRGDTASVNEVLATQPGFVYDAFGNLYARGNHANIQYEIDGVPLPDSVSGLFGGFLSSKLVENMEVLTGGLGAEYGERLAGVVNLNSRRPSEAGDGELELTYGSFRTVNPSGLYGKRTGDFSFLVGGSFKGTDRALDPQAVSPIIHDGGDEERGFARLDYDFDDRDHLSLLVNFSRNAYGIPIDPTVQPCNPSLPDCGRSPDQFGNPPPPYFPADTRASETERDLLALLSYRHDYGARASLRVAGYYRYSYGFLFGDAPHALGSTQDPCSNPLDSTTCAKTSDVTRLADHAGGTVEYLVRLGEDHVLRIGGKVDQLRGQDDFISYTRSDTLQGPDPSLTVSGTDKSHATSGGAYVTDRATFGNLVVNAGLRLDFQKVSFVGSPDQATQIGLGPRVGVSYSFSASTVAHAFAGLMWMPPPVLDTPAAARILGAVPADQPILYDLRPEVDRYAELGIESRVVPAVTLKLTAWGRLSTDQLDDVEVGSTNLVSPYNFDRGRATGLEAGAATVVSRWLTAFGNVAWELAQGRGIATAKYLFSADDLANDRWQTLDHAQTWTANAGATVRDGGTQLSTALNYGSGLRTGPNNDRHVPGHVRVDLTLAHRFLSAPGTPSVALDIVNLFDARYAYRIANGFNGSHYAPERSAYLRVGAAF
jgi:outer membrane cobalamin receptor